MFSTEQIVVSSIAPVPLHKRAGMREPLSLDAARCAPVCARRRISAARISELILSTPRFAKGGIYVKATELTSVFCLFLGWYEPFLFIIEIS